MKIYISGPMTGYPEFNFPAFNEKATELRAAGFDVVNPAETGIVAGWEWEDYIRYDVRVLMDCDAIYTLDGWQESRGARLEVHIAEALNFDRLGVA